MEEILGGKKKTMTKEKAQGDPKNERSGSNSSKNSDSMGKGKSSGSEKNEPIPQVTQSNKKDPTSKRETFKKQETSNQKSLENPKRDNEVSKSKAENQNSDSDPPKPEEKPSKPSKPAKNPIKTPENENPALSKEKIKDDQELPGNRSINHPENPKFHDSKTLKTQKNESTELNEEKLKQRSETLVKKSEKPEIKKKQEQIKSGSEHSSSKHSSKSDNKEEKKVKKPTKIIQKKEKNENSDEADDEIELKVNKNPSNNVTEGEILQQLGVLSKKNTSKLEENESYSANNLENRSSPQDKKKNPKAQVQETPSFPSQVKKSKNAKMSDSNEENAIKVSDSQNSQEKKKKPKQQVFEKDTFGDKFPHIDPDVKSRRKDSSASSSQRNRSSRSGSNKRKNQAGGLVGDIFAGKVNELMGADRDRSSSPETPNLASPVKPVKNNKGGNKIEAGKGRRDYSGSDASDERKQGRKLNEKKGKKPQSPDSAVWISQQEEIRKLKQQLKEYETIIEKQSLEINDLKKSQNLLTGPKRKLSPKSSGFLQKRTDGTFLQKNNEMLKRDDFDFWKINDEASSTKEPQKLEDIAALKDLWILNMESGAQLHNNLSGKKNPGVKANPLTKFESNKSANIRNRFLPKISTKKDLSK